MRTRVLIVGGGPVGLTLAMDLAWRGIDVVVAERRPLNDPPNVKCGQIGARSMEIFRRLGVADKLRGIGLPADYPNDIVSATSVTGIELSRVLDSGARRARHACRSRAGHYLADARAHASLQSEVLRAGAVRARRGAAAHPYPASHRDHGPGPGRAGRDRERRRPRWRHALNDRMRLPRRMRRGEFVCAQVDRLRVRRHPGAPVRAIVPRPGTATQEPAAWQAGLALLLAQSAPLRHDDGCRRAGDLEHTELLLSWRNRAGSP